VVHLQKSNLTSAGKDLGKAVSHGVYTDSQSVEDHLKYDGVPNTRIM
jgi:hypothetical protein